MRILLDENFPLALYRSLKAAGQSVDHIITLGLRGTPDRLIREQLFDEDVLFRTQDDDFLFEEPTAAVVVLSRVRQSRALADRVEVWQRAILELIETGGPERRYELMDDGTLLAWEYRPGAGWEPKRRPPHQGGPDTP